MRIAIYHDLPSGGAKHTLYETMKRLSKRHDLDVYTIDTSDKQFFSLTDFSTSEFIYPYAPSKLFQRPFGRLNQLQRWKDLRRLDSLAQEISKKIDSKKYDVVFAQPCMWTQAPLVLRYLQTPTVYYCHELPRNIYEPISLKRNGSIGNIADHFDPFIQLYQSTLKKFDLDATRSAGRVLVNSKFIQEQVKGTYEIEPVINYHGVDTEVFYPLENSTTKPYVLSVGAVQPHKGFDFLIESLGYVAENLRPGLRLIGNAENSFLKNYLYALAEKNKVNLEIELKVSLDTLVQRYNEALMVVYAPYNEPFGLVPLEAMACRKPVVGIHEGGVLETVVDGETGLLVERDPEKFGQAIQWLLENPHIAAEYGKNGRERVLAQWSWEKSVMSLEQTMSQLL